MTEENLTLLSKIATKTKRKPEYLKEFEEGFRVFQHLMATNLKYLEGKPDTSNQELQVVDEEGIKRHKEMMEKQVKLQGKGEDCGIWCRLIFGGL